MKFSNNFFAIILIGGIGSRFSKINEYPKHLVKLNKRSLLENLIISFVKIQSKPSSLKAYEPTPPPLNKDT